MPAATRSYPPDIATPLTQTSLLSGLREALIATGFPPPLKQYSSGPDQFVVWQIVGDATKTYGTAYYRLFVNSALNVNHMIGATWADSSNTLGNPSSALHSVTYSASTPIKFLGFSTNEYKFLLVTQGATQQLLGYFRPPDAPSFDENSFPRIFIASNQDLTNCSCTGLSPYGTNLTFNTSLGNSQMASPDSFLQQRSQALGLFLFGPANTGIIARTSDDLGMGATSGLSRGDTLVDAVDSSKQYFVNRGVAGGLLIRI